MSASSRSSDLHLTIFSYLWAIAALSHQLVYHDGLAGYAVILGSILVIFRPRSTLALLGLIAAEFWTLQVEGPLTSNHWIYVSFVNLAIVLSALVLITRAKDWRIDRAALSELTQASVRPLLVLVYFFAVLSKLNHDFFDPSVSCATSLYNTLSIDLGFEPNHGMKWVAILGTVIVEASIPVLLLFPMTRASGVLLGIGLHFVVGFFPPAMYPWSMAIFASYIMFLPETWLERVGVALQARLPTRLAVGSINFVLMALIIWYGAATLAHIAWSDMGLRMFLLVYASAFVAALVSQRKHARGVQKDCDSPWGSAAIRVATAVSTLFVLNGLSPYTGLKIRSSFAMFSNLRTEGGRSNHLFLPIDLQAFDYQRYAPIVPTNSCP